MSLPLALLLSSALAGLALWKRALTPGGTLLAWAMCLAICRIGALLAYAAVMAESLSDSLASKLGPLGKGKTVDICSFREVGVGLSGGISGAGSVAAALGAALIGALCLLFPGADGKTALLVTLLGFLGCLIDSVLGSLIQVKYRCPACGALTERESHCGVPGKVERGWRRVNNDTVNLLSNLFAAALAILFFEGKL